MRKCIREDEIGVESRIFYRVVLFEYPFVWQLTWQSYFYKEMHIWHENQNNRERK